MNVLYVVIFLCGTSFACASTFTYKRLRRQMTLSLKSIDNNDPIANSLQGIALRRAVLRGDVHAVKDVLNGGSNELREFCVKHLVSSKRSKLVKLLYNGNHNNPELILRVILVHADHSLIDEIFAGFQFSNDILNSVAASADLACIPQRFIYFLGKINEKDAQECAVKYGIHALFSANRTECLDPLLSALGERAFLGEHLVNVAILKIFWSASFHPTMTGHSLPNVSLITLQSLPRTTPMLYTSLTNGARLQDSFTGCWKSRSSRLEGSQE